MLFDNPKRSQTTGLFLSVWHLPKRRLLSKSLSLIIALTFIFPYLTWAFENDALLPKPGTIRVQGLELEIPAKLGTITASFQGLSRTVVYVQDLHCHYEVQSHISSLIDMLAAKHGLKIVGVEAVEHTLDVSKLSTFPLQSVKEATSDHLMREGKITGPEHYAATGVHPIRLEGIETAELYRNNYQGVASFLNDENEGLIYDLREALAELKGSVYNPVLRDFDQWRADHRSGRLPLVKYAAWLARKAGQTGATLEPYPNLSAYLREQGGSLSRDVDADALFRELDGLDQVLRRPLYIRDTEQELDRLESCLDIMERMLNISATRSELKTFLSQPDRFCARAFRDFFSRYPASADLDLDLSGLDEALDAVRSFYRTADARSLAFVRHLETKMQQQNAELAMLVSGGYHTEEVLAELRRKRISYVCVKPALTQQDVLNPYFSLLRGRRTPLEKLLAQNQNLLQTPRPFPEISQAGSAAVPLDVDQQVFERLLDTLLDERTLAEGLRTGHRTAAKVRDYFAQWMGRFPRFNPQIVPLWSQVKADPAGRAFLFPFSNGVTLHLRPEPAWPSAAAQRWVAVNRFAGFEMRLIATRDLTDADRQALLAAAPGNLVRGPAAIALWLSTPPVAGIVALGSTAMVSPQSWTVFRSAAASYLGGLAQGVPGLTSLWQQGSQGFQALGRRDGWVRPDGGLRNAAKLVLGTLVLGLALALVVTGALPAWAGAAVSIAATGILIYDRLVKEKVQPGSVWIRQKLPRFGINVALTGSFVLWASAAQAAGFEDLVGVDWVSGSVYAAAGIVTAYAVWRLVRWYRTANKRALAVQFQALLALVTGVPLLTLSGGEWTDTLLTINIIATLGLVVQVFLAFVERQDQQRQWSRAARTKERPRGPGQRTSAFSRSRQPTLDPEELSWLRKVDFYSVLQVGRGDNAETIQSAFRRLAREWHPDVNKDDPKAENKFKEIIEAYEVLRDETKRAKYERFLEKQSQLRSPQRRGMGVWAFFLLGNLLWSLLGSANAFAAASAVQDGWFSWPLIIGYVLLVLVLVLALRILGGRALAGRERMARKTNETPEKQKRSERSSTERRLLEVLMKAPLVINIMNSEVQAAFAATHLADPSPAWKQDNQLLTELIGIIGTRDIQGLKPSARKNLYHLIGSLPGQAQTRLLVDCWNTEPVVSGRQEIGLALEKRLTDADQLFRTLFPAYRARFGHLINLKVISSEGFFRNDLLVNERFEEWAANYTAAQKTLGKEKFLEILAGWRNLGEMELIAVLDEPARTYEYQGYKTRFPLADGSFSPTDPQPPFFATLRFEPRVLNGLDELNDKLEKYHNEFIVRNYAVLQLIGSRETVMNKRTAKTILTLADGMLETCETIFPDKTRALRQDWERLKRSFEYHWHSLNDEDEIPDELRSRIVELEPAGYVMGSRTVHQFIQHLHAASLEWRDAILTKSGTNLRVTLHRPGDLGPVTIRVAQMDRMPLLSGVAVTSELLRTALMAWRDIRQEPPGCLVLSDRNFSYSTQLGVHQIMLFATREEPEDGGEFRLNYFENDEFEANRLRLEFLVKGLEDQGVMVRSGYNSHRKYLLSALLDKDHGARNAQHIMQALYTVLRSLVYINQNLDMAFNALNESKYSVLKRHEALQSSVQEVRQMASVLTAEDRLPFFVTARSSNDTTLYNRFLGFLSSEEVERRLEVWGRLNRELGRLGLPLIRSSEFGQKVIQEQFDQRIQTALKHGQLIWQGGSLVPNPYYHPVQLVRDSIRKDEIGSLNLAIRLKLDRVTEITLRRVGRIGQLTLMEGNLFLPAGRYALFLLREGDEGRIFYGALRKLAAGGKFEFVSPSKAERILLEQGFISPEHWPVARALGSLAKTRLERNGAEENLTDLMIRGIPLSIGRSEAAFGQISFDRTNLGSLAPGGGRRILAVPYTTPEDLPALEKAAAVITTAGSPLSHTAIVAREMGIPALVCRRGAWEGTEKGGRLVFHEETTRVEATLGGFRRAVIKEGDMALLLGREGLLVLFPHAGTLDVADIFQFLRSLVSWPERTTIVELAKMVSELMASGKIPERELAMLLWSAHACDQTLDRAARIAIREVLGLSNDAGVSESIPVWSETTITLLKAVDGMWGGRYMNELETLLAEAEREILKTPDIPGFYQWLVKLESDAEAAFRTSLGDATRLKRLERIRTRLAGLALHPRLLAARESELKALLKVGSGSLSQKRAAGAKWRRAQRMVDRHLIPDRPMNVMFVCSGNTDRSPMAASIFQHLLTPEESSGVRIWSRAAFSARGGQLTPLAETVLSKNGIAPPKHISKTVSDLDMASADLVLGMTWEHVKELHRLFPQFAQKTFLLDQFATGGRREVSDPFGGNEEEYQSTFRILKMSLEAAMGIFHTLRLDAPTLILNFRQEADRLAQKHKTIRSSQWILPLSELDETYTREAGGKAAALGELMAGVAENGGVVPKGIALTTDLFNEFLKTNGSLDKYLELVGEIETLTQETDWQETKAERVKALSQKVQNLIQTGEWNGLDRDVLKGLSSNGLAGSALAVRSSSAEEDGAYSAFAGAAETSLFVRPENLLKQVIRIWQSFWKYRAIVYRASRRFDQRRVRPAVLVQEMVEAEASGLIFTLHPETSRVQNLIEANWGLGESIVSGVAEGDVFELDKATGDLINPPRLGKKQIRSVPTSSGDGTHLVQTDKRMRNSFCLSPALVMRLGRLARGLERLAGKPLDIEFATKGDTLYILQARPITSLPKPDAAFLIRSWGSLETGKYGKFESRFGQGVWLWLSNWFYDRFGISKASYASNWAWWLENLLSGSLIGLPVALGVFWLRQDVVLSFLLGMLAAWAAFYALHWNANVVDQRSAVRIAYANIMAGFLIALAAQLTHIPADPITLGAILAGTAWLISLGTHGAENRLNSLSRMVVYAKKQSDRWRNLRDRRVLVPARPVEQTNSSWNFQWQKLLGIVLAVWPLDYLFWTADYIGMLKRFAVVSLIFGVVRASVYLDMMIEKGSAGEIELYEKAKRKYRNDSWFEFLTERVAPLGKKYIYLGVIAKGVMGLYSVVVHPLIGAWAGLAEVMPEQAAGWFSWGIDGMFWLSVILLAPVYFYHYYADIKRRAVSTGQLILMNFWLYPSGMTLAQIQREVNKTREKSMSEIRFALDWLLAEHKIELIRNENGPVIYKKTEPEQDVEDEIKVERIHIGGQVYAVWDESATPPRRNIDLNDLKWNTGNPMYLAAQGLNKNNIVPEFNIQESPSDTTLVPDIKVAKYEVIKSLRNDYPDLNLAAQVLFSKDAIDAARAGANIIVAQERLERKTVEELREINAGILILYYIISEQLLKFAEDDGVNGIRLDSGKISQIDSILKDWGGAKIYLGVETESEQSLVLESTDKAKIIPIFSVEKALENARLAPSVKSRFGKGAWRWLSRWFSDRLGISKESYAKNWAWWLENLLSASLVGLPIAVGVFWLRQDVVLSFLLGMLAAWGAFYALHWNASDPDQRSAGRIAYTNVFTGLLITVAAKLLHLPMEPLSLGILMAGTALFLSFGIHLIENRFGSLSRIAARVSGKVYEWRRMMDRRRNVPRMNREVAQEKTTDAGGDDRGFTPLLWKLIGKGADAQKMLPFFGIFQFIGGWLYFLIGSSGAAKIAGLLAASAGSFLIVLPSALLLLVALQEEDWEKYDQRMLSKLQGLKRVYLVPKPGLFLLGYWLVSMMNFVLLLLLTPVAILILQSLMVDLVRQKALGAAVQAHRLIVERDLTLTVDELAKRMKVSKAVARAGLMHLAQPKGRRGLVQREVDHEGTELFSRAPTTSEEAEDSYTADLIRLDEEKSEREKLARIMEESKAKGIGVSAFLIEQKITPQWELKATTGDLKSGNLRGVQLQTIQTVREKYPNTDLAVTVSTLDEAGMAAGAGANIIIFRNRLNKNQVKKTRGFKKNMRIYYSQELRELKELLEYIKSVKDDGVDGISIGLVRSWEFTKKDKAVYLLRKEPGLKLAVETVFSEPHGLEITDAGRVLKVRNVEDAREVPESLPRTDETPGGIMPWLKEWYVERGAPSEDLKARRALRYDRWAGVFLELLVTSPMGVLFYQTGLARFYARVNAPPRAADSIVRSLMVVSVTQIVAGLSIGILIGDWTLAGKIVLLISGPAFTGFHFLAGVRAGPAAKPNKFLALGITTFNLALLFLTSFSILELITANLLSHLFVNWSVRVVRVGWTWWKAHGRRFSSLLPEFRRRLGLDDRGMANPAAPSESDEHMAQGNKTIGLGVLTSLTPNPAFRVPAYFFLPKPYVDQIRSTGDISPEVRAWLEDGVERLAKTDRSALAQSGSPLLLAVRSAPVYSAPEMYRTVINLGLTDRLVERLAKDPRWGSDKAYRAYLTLIATYAAAVHQIAQEVFAEAESDFMSSKGQKRGELSAAEWRELTLVYHKVLKDRQVHLPQSLDEQLTRTLTAVAGSYDAEHARDFRAHQQIPEESGLEIVIQRMVLGLGRDSGSGVVYSRDPDTGEAALSGAFLPDSQGVQMVSGEQAGFDLNTLGQERLTSWEGLLRKLEKDRGIPVEVEFTLEKGTAYFIQLREAKMSPPAWAVFLREQVVNRRLTVEQAADKIKKEIKRRIMRVKNGDAIREIARGSYATHGAIHGRLALSLDAAKRLAEKGPVVLLTDRLNDQAFSTIFGLSEIGLITTRGGPGSHQIVLTRAAGIPAMTGLPFEIDGKAAVIGNTTIQEEEWVILDCDRKGGQLGRPGLDRPVEEIEPLEYLHQCLTGFDPDQARHRILAPYLAADGSLRPDLKLEQIMEENVAIQLEHARLISRAAAAPQDIPLQEALVSANYKKHVLGQLLERIGDREGLDKGMIRQALVAKVISAETARDIQQRSEGGTTVLLSLSHILDLHTTWPKLIEEFVPKRDTARRLARENPGTVLREKFTVYHLHENEIMFTGREYTLLLLENEAFAREADLRDVLVENIRQYGSSTAPLLVRTGGAWRKAVFRGFVRGGGKSAADEIKREAEAIAAEVEGRIEERTSGDQFEVWVEFGAVEPELMETSASPRAGEPLLSVAPAMAAQHNWGRSISLLKTYPRPSPEVEVFLTEIRKVNERQYLNYQRIVNEFTAESIEDLRRRVSQVISVYPGEGRYYGLGGRFDAAVSGLLIGIRRAQAAWESPQARSLFGLKNEVWTAMTDLTSALDRMNAFIREMDEYAKRKMEASPRKFSGNDTYRLELLGIRRPEGLTWRDIMNAFYHEAWAAEPRTFDQQTREVWNQRISELCWAYRQLGELETTLFSGREQDRNRGSWPWLRALFVSAGIKGETYDTRIAPWLENGLSAAVFGATTGGLVYLLAGMTGLDAWAEPLSLLAGNAATWEGFYRLHAAPGNRDYRAPPTARAIRNFNLLIGSFAAMLLAVQTLFAPTYVIIPWYLGALFALSVIQHFSANQKTGKTLSPGLRPRVSFALSSYQQAIAALTVWFLMNLNQTGLAGSLVNAGNGGAGIWDSDTYGFSALFAVAGLALGMIDLIIRAWEKALKSIRSKTHLRLEEDLEKPVGTQPEVPAAENRSGSEGVNKDEKPTDVPKISIVSRENVRTEIERFIKEIMEMKWTDDEQKSLVKAKDKIIEKIAGMHLQPGRRVLVVGPGSRDLLPVLLHRLGLKVSIIDIEPMVLRSEQLTLGKFGADEVSAYNDYDAIIKTQPFNYIMMFGFLHDNLQGHTKLKNILDNIGIEDKAALEKQWQEDIQTALKPILKHLDTDNGIVFINNIADGRIPKPQLKTALETVGRSLKMEFDPLNVNVHDLSLQSGYFHESRDGLVVQARPLTNKTSGELKKMAVTALAAVLGSWMWTVAAQAEPLSGRLQGLESSLPVLGTSMIFVIGLLGTLMVSWISQGREGTESNQESDREIPGNVRQELEKAYAGSRVSGRFGDELIVLRHLKDPALTIRLERDRLKETRPGDRYYSIFLESGGRRTSYNHCRLVETKGEINLTVVLLPEGNASFQNGVGATLVNWLREECLESRKTARFTKLDNPKMRTLIQRYFRDLRKADEETPGYDENMLWWQDMLWRHWRDQTIVAKPRTNDSVIREYVRGIEQQENVVLQKLREVMPANLWNQKLVSRQQAAVELVWERTKDFRLSKIAGIAVVLAHYSRTLNEEAGKQFLNTKNISRLFEGTQDLIHEDGKRSEIQLLRETLRAIKAAPAEAQSNVFLWAAQAAEAFEKQELSQGLSNKNPANRAGSLLWIENIGVALAAILLGAYFGFVDQTLWKEFLGWTGAAVVIHELMHMLTGLRGTPVFTRRGIEVIPSNGQDQTAFQVAAGPIGSLLIGGAIALAITLFGPAALSAQAVLIGFAAVNLPALVWGDGEVLRERWKMRGQDAAREPAEDEKAVITRGTINDRIKAGASAQEIYDLIMSRPDYYRLLFKWHSLKPAAKNAIEKYVRQDPDAPGRSVKTLLESLPNFAGRNVDHNVHQLMEQWLTSPALGFKRGTTRIGKIYSVIYEHPDGTVVRMRFRGNPSQLWPPKTSFMDFQIEVRAKTDRGRNKSWIALPKYAAFKVDAAGRALPQGVKDMQPWFNNGKRKGTDNQIVYTNLVLLPGHFAAKFIDDQVRIVASENGGRLKAVEAGPDRSVGGIWLWLQGWLARFGVSPATYAKWVAWLVENALSYAAGAALVYGVLPFLDVTPAFNMFYMTSWTLFFALHFIPSRTAGRAPPGNIAAAFLITVLNLALLASPLSIPWIIGASFATHGGVNWLGPWLAERFLTGEVLRAFEVLYPKGRDIVHNQGYDPLRLLARTLTLAEERQSSTEMLERVLDEFPVQDPSKTDEYVSLIRDLGKAAFDEKPGPLWAHLAGMIDRLRSVWSQAGLEGVADPRPDHYRTVLTQALEIIPEKPESEPNREVRDIDGLIEFATRKVHGLVLSNMRDLLVHSQTDFLSYLQLMNTLLPMRTRLIELEEKDEALVPLSLAYAIHNLLYRVPSVKNARQDLDALRDLIRQSQECLDRAGQEQRALTVNEPLLYRQPWYFRNLPLLFRFSAAFRGWRLGIGRMGNVSLPTQRINRIQILQNLARRVVPQYSADIFRTGTIRFEAVEKKRDDRFWAGLRQWLGDYRDTRTETVFYLPGELLVKLDEADQRINSENATERDRRLIDHAQNLLAYQAARYFRDTVSNRMAQTSMDREFLPDRDEEADPTAKPFDPKPVISVDEYYDRGGDIVITQQEVLQLFWNCMLEVQGINGGAAGEAAAIGQLKADLARRLRGDRTDLATVLNAVAYGQASGVTVLALRTLLKGADKLKEAERSWMQNGIADVALSVLASSGLTKRGARARARTRSWVNEEVNSVRLLGLPKELGERMFAEIDTAVSGLKDQENIEGLLERLSILKKTVAYMSSNALDQAVPVEKSGLAWSRQLAGMVADAQDIRADQGYSELGMDLNDQPVIGIKAGVEEIELAGKIRVSKPVLVEVSVHKTDIPQVLKKIGEREEPLPTARVFVQRQVPAELAAEQLPVWLARTLLMISDRLPERSRYRFHGLVMRMSPRWYLQTVFAQVPKELRDSSLGREFQAFIQNPDDPTPLALAYREMVSARSPRSRADLAKTLLRIIRAEQTGSTAAQNTYQWLFFSTLFRYMAAVPTTEIADPDSLKSVDADLWLELKDFPGNLGTETFRVPAALLEINRGRGSLGFITSRLEKGPYSVRENIIRLFLRKGLRSFRGSA